MERAKKILFSLFIFSSNTLYANELSYTQDIQPIFKKRCVSCHSCYDAPCSLKLSSFSGVQRGASKQDLYGNRIGALPQTRLDEDAKSVVEWRKKGFWPVVPDKFEITSDKRKISLLSSMVKLGQLHSQPKKIKDVEQRSPDQCISSVKELKVLPINMKKQLGMPYGLPALDNSEVKMIEKWVQNNAKGPSFDEYYQATLSKNPEIIKKWESFFNNKSNKNQWTAKYLYEHLYISHLHFKESPGEFYRLTRSKTPAPHLIDEIITPMPYSDPKEHFYYRLKKITSVIVHKTHIVNHLDDRKLKRWKEIFLEPEWKASKVSLNWNNPNPFENFATIPALSRYTWMLENSKHIVDLFTRGPVCNGSVATYAVRDHFWTFFLDPRYEPFVINERLLFKYSDMLEIPDFDKNTMPINYQSKALKFSKFRSKVWKKAFIKGLSLPMIWKGEGANNPNSLLTIFRHELSVSVHNGIIGGTPKTFWLIDYPLFERIYYNLVAGFNVYGSLDHKVMSRVFMESLRREGEDLFLSMLPKDLRLKVRNDWYQTLLVKNDLITESFFYNDIDTQIKVPEADPKKSAKYLAELIAFTRLGKKKSKLLSDGSLEKINEKIGGFNKFFRNISYLMVKKKDGRSKYYTFIANRYHKTMNIMFLESLTRSSDLDTISIIDDLQLSYPNIIFSIKQQQMDEFIDQALTIQNSSHYIEFEKKWAIKKNNPKFWVYFDKIQDHFDQLDLIETGVLDLNRYEHTEITENRIGKTWDSIREETAIFFERAKKNASKLMEQGYK